MTRPGDDTPTIREGANPKIKKESARDSSLEEFVEPVLTGPYFQGYQLIRQFPAAGGEADIWLILKGGNYSILKHYRLGIEPKKEVLEKVSNISKQHSKNLIRILSFGYDEETRRWFEIQEYAKNGSLKDLIQAHTISTVQFRTIIEEITAGLEALHRENILHLDLKPSNILIRSLRPLNLILTDFGISTLLDTELSRQITSTKGTPMYWAPEQLGNIVGKEADFWALGVIALEIHMGHHPFAGMNHNIILASLSTKGIIVPSEIQPKTGVLLKGLLTRDPKKRWTAREIHWWLSGRQNIPIYYEEERNTDPRAATPYSFRDEQITQLRDLCYAFIQDSDSWEDAKRHIGRGYLTRWLEKTEQWGAAVEVEKYIEQYPQEDERVLYLAAKCNPDIPFTLYGKPLDIASIVNYLGRYLERKYDDQEKQIISMLFSGDLQRIYQNYITITAKRDDSSLIARMFTWLSENTRGIDEKSRLYDYLRVLKEREELGSPEEWDTRTIIKLAGLRDLFLKQGYGSDASRIEEELQIACESALIAEQPEPDLLVALATTAEEIGQTTRVHQCLKKAAESDIRVISLLFNKKRGIERFQLYTRLRKEYETRLFSLSSEPWNQTAEFWRNMFTALMDKGEYSLALSVSERLIEMNREEGEGYAMRGLSLARLGRVREGEFFAAHPMVQRSESAQVKKILGDYYGAVNQPEDTEKTFLNGLAANPSDKEMIRGLITFYSTHHRRAEIIAACEKYLKLNPDDSDILHAMADAQVTTGRFTDAIQTYNKCLALSPTNTDLLNNLARCQIKLKNYTEADNTINVLMRQGVKDAHVLRMKAYLLLIRGKVQDAIRYLDRSLEYDPDDLWTLRIKADAHISLKEYRQALVTINQVLRLDPGNHQVREKEGAIFLILGWYQDAETSLRGAIEGGRISADLFLKYADVLRQGNQTRYGSFTRMNLEEGRSLNWRCTRLYLDIWDMPEHSAQRVERLMTAGQWYEKAQAQGADAAHIANREGIIATLLGDYPKAQEHFEQAIQKNLKEQAFQTNLAVMYVLQGRLDQGKTILTNILNLEGTTPYALDQYAGIFFREGNFQGAWKLNQQAVLANTGRDPLIPYHALLTLRAIGLPAEEQKMRELVHSLNPWFDIS